MLQTLILENFMAHGRTELALGPGLTVLSGPNNVGKSAVVEALRCLASNPPPRHFIRHGAKEARVTAVLDDGTAVTWVRREKHALYEVLRPGAAEPEVFAKLGRKGAVPDEVAALLRLGPVEVLDGQRSIDVHVGNQREPVFLLNESPAVLASLLAASTEAGHLLNMQKALAVRVRDAKRREKELAAQSARLDAHLRALAPLPGLTLAVDEAEALHGRARASRQALPGLEGTCVALRRAAAGRVALAARLDALARLAPPAPPAPVAALAAWLARRAALHAARRDAAARTEALAQLGAPPAVADTAAQAGLLAGLARLGAMRQRAGARAEALAPLAPPPALADMAALARALQEIARLRGLRVPLAARLAGLESLCPPPAPQAPSALAATLAALRRSRAQVETARQARAAAATAEAACAERAREVLARAGNCPLCGQTLDAAAFLSRVADAPRGKAGEEA